MIHTNATTAKNTKEGGGHFGKKCPLLQRKMFYYYDNNEEAFPIFHSRSPLPTPIKICYLYII